jgi:signal transduction histidine kinase
MALKVFLFPYQRDKDGRKNIMTEASKYSVFGRYRKIIVAMTAFWTLCVGVSLWLNIDRTYRYTEEAARLQARTAFDKDVIYRRWSSRLGGVYAKVTDITPPNPYLKDPERDILGPKGEPLTKINPAYMTRIVHELGQLSSGVSGHITSNKPIRPGNAPDPWEAKALSLLENNDGMKEFAEQQTMNGKPYLRFIGSLITEESCMVCHAFQGYKVGEQRGGISISVPMEPFLAQANSSMVALSASHAGFWLFGMTFFFIFIRNLARRDEKVTKAQEETTGILTTVHEGLFLLGKDGKLGTQFSASLPQMLQRNVVPGMDFIAVLREMVPPKIFEAATDYIELLLGDRVKEALVTSLNPLTNVPISTTDQTGADQQRYLTFSFNRVVVAGEISHLLVTVQDVTELVSLLQRLEQAKKQSKIEVEALLQLLSGDIDSLRQFIANVDHGLGQINKELSHAQDDRGNHLHTLASILRIVHGIKGEAAALGINVLENYAHECEKEMVAMRESGEEIGGDHMVRISVLLEGFYERYSSLAVIIEHFGAALGKTRVDGEERGGVELRKAESPAVVQQITALAQRIAKEQNKQVDVSCRLEKLLTLPARVAQELQSISIQLVRNAMTHGIETPAERSAVRKSETGQLQIWCERSDNEHYDFVVRDDGRGIVPRRLRTQLAESGKMSREEVDRLSDNEVASMLFHPGVSTATVANRDAGHGIGLDIVLEKVKTIKGHLRVTSRSNLFTEFRIRFSSVF